MKELKMMMASPQLILLPQIYKTPYCHHRELIFVYNLLYCIWEPKHVNVHLIILTCCMSGALNEVFDNIFIADCGDY